MHAERLPTESAGEWYAIDRAAALTGLSERAWRFRAQALESEGKSRRVPTGKGPPRWEVHRTADPKLTYRRGEAEEAVAIRALSGEFSERDIRRAELRLRWLKRYWEQCRTSPRGARKRDIAAKIVADAKAAEGDAIKISVRSIESWERRYNEINPDTRKRRGVDGLLDRYSVGERDTRSPEAVQLYYKLWHTENRLSIAHCHEIVRDEATRNGWNWPASEGATRAWLNKYDNRSITLLMRHGAEAYAHKAMPHIEQDYSKVSPGQQYDCDHHLCKFFVQHRKKAIRPWLTAITDRFSRVVVGWHLTHKPNSASIMSALRRAFQDWGVPEVVKIDNGWDFTAKAFTGLTKQQLRSLRRKFKAWKEIVRRERERLDLTGDAAWFGILPELGCRIVYATPYAGWTKHVERWFRTFTDRFSRTQAAFCDTSPTLKPTALGELVADVRALPTIDETATEIAKWIDKFHATAHDGDGIAGLTPREAWSSKLAVTRAAPDGVLDLLCNVRGVYKVRKNGVHVSIAGQRVGYGQYDRKLRSHFGRQVLVAVDPQNIDEAVIMTAERGQPRRVICRVTRNEGVSPVASTTEQDLRDAVAKMKSSRRDMHQAQRSAPTRQKSVEQIVAEQRRKDSNELRATGTHGKPGPRPDQTIRIVQTGIDVASISDRPRFEPDINLADLAGDDDESAAAEERMDLSDFAYDDGESADDDEDMDVFDLTDLVDGEEDSSDADEGPSLEDLA